jgi:hypothetical protein
MKCLITLDADRTKALSRKDLLSWIERQNKITSEMCQQFVNTGRGHETMATTRTKSDFLSTEYVRACTFESELCWEKERRMTYHGKLTPIKKEE